MTKNNASSKQSASEHDDDDDDASEKITDAPWRKAVARSIASYGTWFVTEYPKLILQQQQQQQSNTSKQHPLLKTWDIYQTTSLSNHVRGATSSAAQRGSSALIMFYGQQYILQAILLFWSQLSNRTSADTTTTTSSSNIPWYTAGLAGFGSGAVSSLIHTLFEPIKIRHEPLTWKVYRASLWPMMWRHALFDATFFATSTALQQQSTSRQQSYAIQFGISALAASTVNLTHDLWKTQSIQALPHRIKWMAVVNQLTVTSFRQQLVMKATDLGFNWWFTGVLYAVLFANH